MSNGYQVELRGHDQVIAMLEAAGQNTRPVLMSGMTEATALVLTTSVTRYLSGPPGLNRRTGQLSAGLETTVRVYGNQNGSVIEGTVGTKVEHGFHQEMPENGPGVMVIKPKAAKVLAFVTSGQRPDTPEGWKRARAEGRAVYARQVTLRGHAFLKPAALDQEKAIMALFEGKLTRLVGGE